MLSNEGAVGGEEEEKVFSQGKWEEVESERKRVRKS